MKRVTHEITACYFPKVGEVDLTWLDLETREKAALTAKVTPEQGKAISNVVWPCVYSDAAVYRRSLEDSERRENELRHVLKAILADLPANRDWLDPNIERIAKELTGVQS